MDIQAYTYTYTLAYTRGVAQTSAYNILGLYYVCMQVCLYECMYVCPYSLSRECKRHYTFTSLYPSLLVLQEIMAVWEQAGNCCSKERPCSDRTCNWTAPAAFCYCDSVVLWSATSWPTMYDTLLWAFGSCVLLTTRFLFAVFFMMGLPRCLLLGVLNYNYYMIRAPDAFHDNCRYIIYYL